MSAPTLSSRCSILAPLLVLAAAVLAVALPGAAAAAVPGQNGRIAFTSSRDGNSEIYTMEPDGTGLRRLTYNPDVDQSPSWSPDGKRIVFESFVGGGPFLFLMDAGGGDRTRLSPDTSSSFAHDLQPAWSPDGKQIAFSSTRPSGASYQIWVINVDGSGLTRLTSTWGTEPAWSLDGSKIAYISTGGALFVMRSDGSDQHRLTSGSDLPEGSPAWSPDGARLVFGRYASGWQTSNARELYAIDADGTNERQLTSGGYSNWTAAWSPDGSQIVFQRHEGTYGLNQLYVMDAAGGSARRLDTLCCDEIGPDWAVYNPDPPPPRSDPSGPEIVLQDPADGAVYWQGQKVQAGYACLPGPLGWPAISCDAPVPLGGFIDTSRVGTWSFTIRAQDYVGAVTTVTHSYTVFDVNPPTVTIESPGDQAVYPRGAFLLAHYSCDDGPGGSGILGCVASVPNDAPLPTDKLGTFVFEVTGYDGAFNHASVRHVYRIVDVTAPTVSIARPVDGAVYRLGQSVTADYACQDDDGGSGIEACDGTVAAGAPLDTATVGAHTFSVSARDHSGNTAIDSRSYTVVYDFDGFGAPLVPLPSLASVRAGDDVPVKFSLHGNFGLGVLAGQPTWQPIPCSSGVATTTDRSQGLGSLSYSAGPDRYVFLWTTDRAWAGTCRQLTVSLRDGTVHRANFAFVR